MLPSKIRQNIGGILEEKVFVGRKFIPMSPRTLVVEMLEVAGDLLVLREI